MLFSVQGVADTILGVSADMQKSTVGSYEA
jgi:hypothetical protein